MELQAHYLRSRPAHIGTGWVRGLRQRGFLTMLAWLRARRLPLLGSLLCLAALPAHAEPDRDGVTGLIHMPDARIEPDGTLQSGLSYEPTYSVLWANIAFLPQLELSGRFTQIHGVVGFTNSSGYGDYKDKAVDAKWQLFAEGDMTPALAFGAQDFTGTELFSSRYLVASKHLGASDWTVGYGQKRIHDWFGGVRYVLGGGWSAVAEYNPIRYALDEYANVDGMHKVKPGPGVGLEYRWGWLGTQVGWQRGLLGINGYVSVPLSHPDFVPKLDEPAPYQATELTRPSDTEWQSDPHAEQRLVTALLAQDFRQIAVAYHDGELRAELANTRISNMHRAVGRAARTLLTLAPQGTRRITVVYTKLDLPVATYHFNDLTQLAAYFKGELDRGAIYRSIDIHYADPHTDRVSPDHREELLAGLAEEGGVRIRLSSDEGQFISLQGSSGAHLSNFNVSPRLGFFFNDPSGVLHYDLGIGASYSQQLREGLFFNTDVSYSLLDTVRNVTDNSNSQLPHVRSDVADYDRASRGKLNRLLVNQLIPVTTRTYARVSAGLYEEMYGGLGGQILHVMDGGHWATDLSVDAVKQRAYGAPFGFLPYETVTALWAIHYRMDNGVTAAVRIGRFLAKDTGARFELRRRFVSGYEIGCWYTRTDARDVTSPGSPTSPYYDKGVFVVIPLNTLLTHDTQGIVSMALRPWARDGGQMVASPGDMYEMMSKPLVNDMSDGFDYFGSH